MFGVAEIAGTETGEGSSVVDIANIEDDSIWYSSDTPTTGELHATTPDIDLLVDIGVSCNMGGLELMEY